MSSLSSLSSLSSVSFAEVQVAAFQVVVRVLAEDPEVKPNPNGLPGIELLKDLVGRALVVALILCLLGLVVSAASWAGVPSRGTPARRQGGRPG
jgi:uncharacterized protein DUF6112